MKRLLNKFPFPDRLTPASTALLYAAFAALWIILSGHLLAVAVPDPLLQHRIELAKGLAFVAVTSGLLYLLLRGRHESLPKPATTVQSENYIVHHTSRSLLIFIALILVVPLTDFVIYTMRVPQAERDAFDNLESIATLKSDEIRNWLDERYGSAQGVAADPAFAQQVMQYLRHQQQDAGLRRQILDKLNSMLANYGFDSILLADTNGRPLLSLGGDINVSPAIHDLLLRSLNSKQVQFSNLYRGVSGQIHMDWVVPLMASDRNGKHAVAIMVLRAIPEKFLYFLIQTWPTASDSGETLLVRRDGMSVIYLNELRHRKNTALRLTLPLTDTTLVSVAAVNAKLRGTIQGRDYRNVPVLAAYRPVTGTDWDIIAKIDRAEVLEPVWVLIYWISVVCLAAMVAIMAALLMLQRQQQRLQHVALMARTAESLRENNELLRLFIEYAPAALAMFDRKMRYLGCSQRWIKDYGLDGQNILGRSHYDVFPEISERWKALHARGMEGEVLRSAEDSFERTDGTLQWLSWEIRPWHQNGGHVGGIVIFSEDITERKVAETKIHRLTQLYAALSQCNGAIVRCASEEELLPQICHAAVEFGGMKMAWIGMVDEASHRVRPVACYGDHTDYLDDIQISVDEDDPFGHGPAGVAIRDNRPFWCQDFQHDPATAPWHERAKNAGWQAMASLPLHRDGITVGTFSLYSDTVNAFDDEACGLLVEMTADVSFALDNFAAEIRRTQAEEQLNFNNTLLETQQETSLDAILVIDRNQKILSWNQRFIDMWRLSPQLLGARDDAPVLESVAAQTKDTASFATGARYLLDHPEVSSHEEILLKDGRIIDRYTAPISGENGEYYGRVVYFRDITERKHAAQELADSEQRFRSLIEQSVAGIYIIQEGKLVYVNPRCAEILGQGSADELIGKDPLHFIVEADRSKVAENMRRLRDHEERSIASDFCLLHKNGITVMVGANATLASYHGAPAIIGMVQDISEKKRDEERILHYIAQLKSSFLSTVQLATSLSEMRDPYTAGHERRVAEIAVAIGAAMGLDEQRMEGIRVAGYLHDIGKISIPAEILVKPGRLSPTEYALVQGHPQAGYDVLKHVDFPWPVAAVALQHHERIDGSGYPNRLKGDEILLESRIMAVADVVEAMATHRPYRPGLGIEKALAEIERGRGTSYDPLAVDTCLRLFREQGFVLPAH